MGRKREKRKKRGKKEGKKGEEKRDAFCVKCHSTIETCVCRFKPKKKFRCAAPRVSLRLILACARPYLAKPKG